MIIEKHFGDATLWAATLTEALALNARDAVSADELDHANGYKIHADRDRFLAGRTLLRYALSQTVHGKVTEDNWQFAVGPFGKPSVATGLPQVSFNLSHAGNCVVVAVSTGASVGVDIEALKRGENAEIIRDCLTVHEARNLDDLSANRQWDGFLSYWTAKEACAKALGLGVALPFNEIEIALTTPPAATIQNPDNADKTFTLMITSLDCGGQSYRLSIATLDRQHPE